MHPKSASVLTENESENNNSVRRFCEVVCVRRLEAERLDGFNFVGRAQRASERSERCERSVEKVLRSTCIFKGLRQRELASYVFEGSR